MAAAVSRPSQARKKMMTQVITFPSSAGIFSMPLLMGGYSTLIHATASSPQKMQYSTLVRPPMFRGILL